MVTKYDRQRYAHIANTCTARLLGHAMDRNAYAGKERCDADTPDYLQQKRKPKGKKTIVRKEDENLGHQDATSRYFCMCRYEVLPKSRM